MPDRSISTISCAVLLDSYGKYPAGRARKNPAHCRMNLPRSHGPSSAGGHLAAVLSPPEAFQIGGADLRALQQLGAGSLERIQAIDHNIPAVSQPQPVIGVLFHDQHGQAV